MRPFIELPDRELAQFEATGRFDWVSDLADIPRRFGVNNVYGELGTCFANTCVTHPKLAAALLGTLVRGLGADHVIWGTDCVWWGSPQWQIEALRRLEIPEDMQKKHGFKPLGAADGAVKTTIFAGNASKLYKIDPAAANKMSADSFDAIGAEYHAMGGLRSNLRYGWCQAGVPRRPESATQADSLFPSFLPRTTGNCISTTDSSMRSGRGGRRNTSRLGPARR